MPTGKIKWFDDQKGFGFIQPDDGGPDVFLHRSIVEAEGITALTEGQPIEFETESSPKGLKAVSIKKTDS